MLWGFGFHGPLVWALNLGILIYLLYTLKGVGFGGLPTFG